MCCQLQFFVWNECNIVSICWQSNQSVLTNICHPGEKSIKFQIDMFPYDENVIFKQKTIVKCHWHNISNKKCVPSAIFIVSIEKGKFF